MEPTDSDANFEPQQRARSNTWPLPRPENYVDKDEAEAGPPDPSKQDSSGLPKKNSSRRNAWGNMSYADLITQAIQSSPEKRLTLSQIYDWMVQNVAYFKDKGDSNSSAGWKNSIRHNLSLHNRFMRVQNEGTGKSSWWMINPDAKPGKAARRRATSMETQKYEKRRGRVKKKVEALRNGLDVTGSPSSSISESLDIFPESPLQHPTFQLSPDFRPRASSNASSCGRLSPIPAVENDMHDGDVSPMSPLPWNSELSSSGTLVGLYTSAGSDRYGTDQLVDTLAETMKIGTTASGSDPGSYLSECTMKASPTNQMSPHMAMPPQQSQQQQPPQQQPQTTNGYSMPPPPYSASSQYADYHSSYPSPADTRKLSPLPASPQRIMHDNMSVTSSYNLTNLQALSPAPSAHSLSPPHSMDTMVPPPTHFGPDRRTPAPPAATSSTTAGERLLSHLSSQSSAYSPSVNPTSGYCALNLQAATPGATSIPAADSTMLRAVLTQKDNGAITTTTPTASQMMGHLMALNSGIPNDLDLSMDALQGELECDVDQVIRHELSVDGNLDFNFADPQNVSSLPTTVAATGGHHWVH